MGGGIRPPSYRRPKSCCSGTDQIVFTVPSNAPTGCWVPVQVRTAGTILSNSTTMAISASAGSPCAEAGNPFAMKFVNGGRLGWLNLFRLAVRRQPTGLTIDTSGDFTSSTFRTEAGGAFVYNPLYLLPPLGACITNAANGNLFWKDAVPGVAATGSTLDAGALLNVAGVKVASNSQTAAYAPLGWFQTGLTSTIKSTLKLNPGTVAVQGSGARNVGSFQSSVTIPTPLTWTNRDQIPGIIDRTQPLTVNFSAVPSGHTVLVMGGYYSPGINATTMFTCTAAGSASSFTIPAYILGSVGTQRSNERMSLAYLLVGSTPLGNPLAISPSGLDYGALFVTVLGGKAVLFQ